MSLSDMVRSGSALAAGRQISTLPVHVASQSAIASWGVQGQRWDAMRGMSPIAAVSSRPARRPEISTRPVACAVMAADAVRRTCFLVERRGQKDVAVSSGYSPDSAASSQWVPSDLRRRHLLSPAGCRRGLISGRSASETPAFPMPVSKTVARCRDRSCTGDGPPSACRAEIPHAAL